MRHLATRPQNNIHHHLAKFPSHFTQFSREQRYIFGEQRLCNFHFPSSSPSRHILPQEPQAGSGFLPTSLPEQASCLGNPTPSGAGWGEAEAPSRGGRGAGSCQALRGPPRWGPDSSLRDPRRQEELDGSAPSRSQPHLGGLSGWTGRGALVPGALHCI